MINIMKADFYRIIRSKGFYIAFAIMLLIIALDIYEVGPGSLALQIKTDAVIENEISNMSHEELEALSLSDYRKIMLNTKGYALDKDILACNMNLYYIFIFIAAIAIAADFSGSTIKNTLSSAISRRKYFISKFMFVNICCLVLFFLNTYIMYAANIVFNNKNLASDLGTITKITLLQIPTILFLISVLTGLAFVLKRTALFNTIVIPLVMICELLLNLFTMLFNIKEEVLNYTPQSMLAKLAYNPSNSYILHCFLICGAATIVCYLIGYWAFQKTEIK